MTWPFPPHPRVLTDAGKDANMSWPLVPKGKGKLLLNNRPWVGLTDAEWEPLYDKFAKYQEYGAFVSGWDNFARAIEAKLKEKNT